MCLDALSEDMIFSQSPKEVEDANLQKDAAESEEEDNENVVQHRSLTSSLGDNFDEEDHNIQCASSEADEVIVISSDEEDFLVSADHEIKSMLFHLVL